MCPSCSWLHSSGNSELSSGMQSNVLRGRQLISVAYVNGTVIFATTITRRPTARIWPRRRAQSGLGRCRGRRWWRHLTFTSFTLHRRWTWPFICWRTVLNFGENEYVAFLVGRRKWGAETANIGRKPGRRGHIVGDVVEEGAGGQRLEEVAFVLRIEAGGEAEHPGAV